MYLKKSQNISEFRKVSEKVILPLSAFRLLALAGGLGLGRRPTTATGRSLLADDLQWKRL